MATVRNRRRAVIAGAAAVALLAVGLGTGAAQAGDQGRHAIVFGKIEFSCTPEGGVELKPWLITNQPGIAVLTEDGALHVDHELDDEFDVGNGLIRRGDTVGSSGATTAVTWTLHMPVEGGDFTADQLVIEPDTCS